MKLTSPTNMVNTLTSASQGLSKNTLEEEEFCSFSFSEEMVAFLMAFLLGTVSLCSMM